MKLKNILKKIIASLGIIIFIIIIVLGIYNKRIILDFTKNIFKKPLTVPEEYSKIDNNKNGIADPLDIVIGAQKEVKKRTKYESNYYDGGYPPEGEGVCTDVIWRGLKEAGISLKDNMDKDIKENVSIYNRVEKNPDPNIDFRRVPNQEMYFRRFCESLTTKVEPQNVENLINWQPGDIVVWMGKYQHVGVIANKRDKNGVPYVIHNSPPHAKISKLTWFRQPIYAHYRWKY